MKKLTLFIATLLVISACNAMDESDAAKDYKEYRKLFNRFVTDKLIFHKLNWTHKNAWSGSTSTLRDESPKYMLAYSGIRPNPHQHCTVVIRNPYNVQDCDSFISKINFDKHGDLDRIETEITLKGENQIRTFERKYKFGSKRASDDQTECKKVINKKDRAVWSCTTKRMSHATFIEKFQKQWDEFYAKHPKPF